MYSNLYDKVFPHIFYLFQLDRKSRGGGDSYIIGSHKKQHSHKRMLFLSSRLGFIFHRVQLRLVQ